MTARRVLHDIYAAPLLMDDPGDGGNIIPNKSLCVVPLETTTAETRTVPVPAKVGLLMTLYMHTDGGDCVVTFTSGYDQYGSTTCTFNTAGDFITVISVATATDTFRWRVVGYDGVAGPAVNLSSINMTGTTGGQEIRLTANLADALSVEDTTGDLLIFDTTTSALCVRVPKGCMFQQGVKANTAGSGVTIPSTDDWGALRVFCDDNGASIAQSVRLIQGRMLCTYDQAAGTIRAVQGHMKFLTGIDCTTGVYTAVQGYTELAGSHNCKTGAVWSCFDSSLEITTSLTVDSGGSFYGVHVETTGAGTITNNGTCAAIGITKASGAASWPVGLYVQDSCCTTGISIGICTTGISFAGAASTMGISMLSQTKPLFQGATTVTLSSASVNAFEITATSPANAAYTLYGANISVIPSTADQATTRLSGVYSEVRSTFNVYSLRGVTAYVNCSAAKTIAEESSAVFGDVNVDNATTVTSGRLSAVHGKVRGDSALTGSLDVGFFDAEMDVDNVLYLNVDTAKTATVGINLAGAGIYTTGIAINGTSVTTAISVGTKSNTAGSGVIIPSTDDWGAVRVFTDDNGANIADSVRGLQSRVLLTIDQSAGSIRAIQGQMKYLTGIDVTTGVYTAVQGYIEMAGTHVCQTGAVQSCFDASTEITISLTIDSGGRFAGIHVETTGAGTITNNGTCAGILIDKASGAASWPVGIQIDCDSVTKGIQVGTLGSNITSGVPILNATSINGFYSDDNGADMTKAVRRNVTARTYFSVNQTVAEADYYALRGHVKIASGVNMNGDQSVIAANNSYLEMAGATTRAANGFLASHFAEIWTDGNLVATASGAKIAGVMSRFYNSAGTPQGTVAAFMATKHFSSVSDWCYGLYIDSATCDIRLANASGAGIYSKATTPNGALTAPKGSICLCPNGTGASDRLWINTDGGTTWTSITCGA